MTRILPLALLAAVLLAGAALAAEPTGDEGVLAAAVKLVGPAGKGGEK